LKLYCLLSIPDSAVLPNKVVPPSGGSNPTEEPLPVLILVICLSVSVFVLLVVIVVCVVRKKNKGLSASTPSSPRQHRPAFDVIADHQSHLLHQHQQQLQQQKQLLQHYPGKSFPKPLPPTPFVAQKWTSSVFPKVPGQPLSTTDSGLFTEYDISKDVDVAGNQYEVPYAHLLPPGGATSSSSSSSSTSSSSSGSNNGFLRSSCCFSGNVPDSAGAATLSSGSGYSGDHLPYRDQRKKYFSECDSQ